MLKLKHASQLDLIEVGGSAWWWESLTPVEQLRVAIGLAWEKWYLSSLPDVLDHPGEMKVEGIYMTHDGESLDVIMGEYEEGYLIAIHEVKATYKSINTVQNPFETQWMWATQTKAYCKGMQETTGQRCTRAYLHVLFLCGDYKYPIQPSLGPDKSGHHVWRADFEQEEIDTTWDMLMSYVRHRQAQDFEDAMKDSE